VKCSPARVFLYSWSEDPLKVPKLEIFVTELFTPSDPIWVGDWLIDAKKLIVENFQVDIRLFVIFTDDWSIGLNFLPMNEPLANF
jgi:hypothetical protein